MGLLDLPDPLFGALDDGLATVLPGGVRLAIWAIIAGVGTLLLYRLLSPQGRIGEAKRNARAARQQLNAFDGEFSDAGPLIRNQFVSAFRHLGLVLLPTLVSILPLLALLTWLESHYAHTLPAPSQAPEIQVTPETYQPQWRDEGNAPHLIVSDSNGELANIAMTAPIPVVEPHQWWNWLAGNPLGYLPAESGIERVTIALPQPEYLPFGPSWMRHWLAIFFPVMLIVSLLTYRWAKIE
ncbi:hypothetical protein [Salinicola avicenniae]|uniref:hypothetical protein n=1 Tax=Salinicola avicenniae TaxID=2916836 RepID=UPI002073971B|nr:MULTISPECIES: hypothetical protein [unclassified Salinicola]